MKIKFICQVGRGSAFGRVWKCKYHGRVYAVKMMVLNTGVHYNKDEMKYSAPFNTTQHELENNFKKDNEVPFLHTKFRHKRGISTERFYGEVENLRNINKIDSSMAPKLKKAWISKKYAVHYGFIMMSFIPLTYHDLDLSRNISSDEQNIVQLAINTLHNKYHIHHGDLKHANVGIF